MPPAVVGRPTPRRVLSHVEVQNLPAFVRDDEEAVQQLECYRWHCQEVERNDHFAVIGEEGQPTLIWITAAQDGPEQPVQLLQPRARAFPLEHGDLGGKARILIAVSCRLRKKTRTAARTARMNSSTKPTFDIANTVHGVDCLAA